MSVGPTTFVGYHVMGARVMSLELGPAANGTGVGLSVGSSVGVRVGERLGL